MMNHETRDSAAGDRLFELLGQWQEAREEGNPQPIREFYAQEPFATDTLLARLSKLADDIDDCDKGLLRLFGESQLPTIPGLKVEEIIGQGGMGVVYKARDEELGREVAVKMVSGGPLVSESMRERFESEARAVAQLQHPNIAEVHAADTIDELPYIVMEFIPGGTLADNIGRQPQPPRQAATLLVKLADAVEFSHQEGIIHRDLKPGNVLLTSRGEPKITDFGLAKWIDRDSSSTKTGELIGTPSYMAPEQTGHRTQSIDPASDVYGLGAILYEMLTGRPPFDTPDPIQTTILVRSEEPVSPRRLQPTIPRDLETICLQCLEKSPQRRYASAAELGADLTRFLNGEPIIARPVGRVERLWKWAKRRPAVATAVVATALIFSGVLLGAVYHSREMTIALHETVQERDRANREANVARLERDRATSAEQKEKKARGYAEDVFDWSITSLGQLENTLRFDEEFPKDARYAHLHQTLLAISTRHYQKIAALKRDDVKDYPALQSLRGDAHWLLGVVQVRLAYGAGEGLREKRHLEDALTHFAEMQKTCKDLADRDPANRKKYQYRFAWSFGWMGHVLHRLNRFDDAILACDRAIALLKLSAHDQAPVKLGACYLERAVIAAKQGDQLVAREYLEMAIATLDKAPSSDDAFVENDRQFYRRIRVNEIADEFANARSYRNAATMYERLSASDPRNLMYPYDIAVCYLAAGDVASYDRLRIQLLKEWGTSDDTARLERLCFTFAPYPLVTLSNEQQSTLLKVADKLRHRGEREKHDWTVRAAGALYFRLGEARRDAGLLSKAIECLTKLNEDHRRGWDWCLLAMSYYRGTTSRERAHQAMSRAEEWILKEKHLGWNERIETERLLADARSMIRAPKEAPKAVSGVQPVR